MGGRHVPQRRLGLDSHEIVIVVDGEEGPRRIRDLPNDDGRDLDGIAICVVDLQVVRLEVPDPNAHVAVLGEGSDPGQAGLVHGSHVTAEELHHPGLTRLDNDQRADNDDGHHDRHGNECFGGSVGEQDCDGDAHGDEEDSEPAIDGPRLVLVNLDARSRLADRSGVKLLV